MYSPKKYGTQTKMSGGGSMLLLCLIGLVLAVVLSGYIQLGTNTAITAKVKRCERIVENDGTSSYLVYTENETFYNKDALWHGKWDSSDLYGSLEEGKVYKFTVYGFRVPFLSMYRNIVEAELIEEQNCEE